MKQNYTNDDEYKEILRKFMAIAFVELPDLQDAFEMLALSLPTTTTITTKISFSISRILGSADLAVAQDLTQQCGMHAQ